jgi:hypothetical protein
VLALVAGLPFGGAMALYRGLIDGDGWRHALVGGGIAGLVFGGLMGPVLYRQNRRLRQVIGELSVRDIRRVGRAAWRGPVPADPEIRSAAYRLAVHRLSQNRDLRVLGVVVLAGWLLVCVILALTQTPWFWLEVLLVAAILGAYLAQQRRLERRAALLAPDHTAV